MSSKNSLWTNIWIAIHGAILKNKGVLISALKFFILKALKFSAMGGIKGWIVKTIVTEFAEEVIETLEVTGDYIVKVNRANDTATMGDRDEATDELNDIMRS